MSNTTQSEEFLQMTVNDNEFVVMKYVNEETEKYREYKFTTTYNDEEYDMNVKFQTTLAEDLDEFYAAYAESELMEIMKSEIRAELEHLTASN